MNGSECPVAKILVYKTVNEFLPIRPPLAISRSNFLICGTEVLQILYNRRRCRLRFLTDSCRLQSEFLHTN